MLVEPIKTHLVKAGEDINSVIVSSIKKIPEKSILVIASKIISTCENRFIKKIKGTPEEKYALVKKEAKYYTNPHSSKYNLMLTVKRNFIFVNAGLDESNADNQYILWPKDPQKSANAIWKFVRKHYGIKDFGVTISDSSSFMLGRGVIGRALVHCGFQALRNYIGQPDLFGKKMKMEMTNVMQSVTDAAVLEMGEGNECTPMAIVSDFQHPIKFSRKPPTTKELAELKIELKDDVYYPLLKSAKWKKGRNL